MYALKIGGSALQNKGNGESHVEQVSNNVAKGVPKGTLCVMTHGAGWTGHNECRRRGIDKMPSSMEGIEFDYGKAVEAANEIRAAIERELTQPLLRALRLAGHIVEPIPISDVAKTTDDDVIFYELSNVVKLARTGVIPLLHSDVVITRNRAFIVSMDEVTKDIANAMGSGTTCIYGTDVPGVLDIRTQKVIPFLRRSELSKVPLAPAAKVDVSGGPERKVYEIMELIPGIPVRIISLREPGTLDAVFRGESVGTLIT